jgi:hypothetical protein
MRWLALLASVLVTIACTTPPLAGGTASAPRTTTSAARTQSPGASPAPEGPAGGYAVLVDLFSATETYDLAIVAGNAKVAVRAHPAKRSAIADALELPYVSASNTRVYYLDGDRHVKFLRADGTSGLATTVPGSASVRAAFAVSPDDKRIAVGLLNYASRPVKLTLYVEDLDGANHRVIYTSTTRYVWPVAWHAGQLVVAYLGPNAVPFRSKVFLYGSSDLAHYPLGPSPYGGINFHVINPTTAARLAIISGGGASGLLTRAGVALVQGDATNWKGQWIDWSSPNDYGMYSAAGSLSPDGKVIAACCDGPGGVGHLVLWYRGDVKTITPVWTHASDWVGWFDSTHLLTGFYQSDDGTPTLFDIETNEMTAVDAHGFVAAMLPGGLD